MLTKFGNSDRFVDAIFPGRYVPLVFLWILFAILSLRISPLGQIGFGPIGVFYVGILSCLGAVSAVAICSTRTSAPMDVAGQLFLFTTFAMCRALDVAPLTEHLVVLSVMTFLMVASFVRGIESLPLGPSLLFVSYLISIKSMSLYVALAFPTLIALGFFLLFASKSKPALPPIASLAAAAIYITRLSGSNQYLDVAFLVIGLCVALTLGIYLYRLLVSQSAQNTNIHLAEDCVVYILLLASLRVYDVFSPLQIYTALAGYCFAASIYHLLRDRRPQFISAAVVAMAALVPVLEEQISQLRDMQWLGMKVLAYSMIGASAAAFSQLYYARLPNHLGKCMFVYASFLLLNELTKWDGAGAKYLVNFEAVAIAVALSAIVFVGGMVVGHLDLHRPSEKLWAGVVSPRLLASGRRLRRSVGNHARSVPAVGFLISVAGSALALLRRAFGDRRHLALSHFSQTMMVALAVPTFAICVQRFVELYFGVDRESDASVLARLGLENGYPGPIRMLSALVLATVLFTAGQILRLAYLRLLAFLMPFGYTVFWFAAYSKESLWRADALITVWACMFVVNYVLAKCFAISSVAPLTAFSQAVPKLGSDLRVIAVFFSYMALSIVMFLMLAR